MQLTKAEESLARLRISGRARAPLSRLDRLYRRSGVNLPFADPRPSHGAEMEGYFWRVTDVEQKRVLVVLCGINRHRDGDWATVAIAAHPGGHVRSAVLPNATAATDRFHVTAGDGAFVAGDKHVRIALGPDARADILIDRPVRWPRALGGGGVFSAVPFLGQYWHPHLLGGSARATATAGGERYDVADGEVYAEKNWGAGFPERWWWGQAQGLEREDVCVAFTGGALPRATGAAADGTT